MMSSKRSLLGLDYFAFFLADIQTGWGPFVAAYLTSVAWSQVDIGLVLTVGTLAAFLLQIPAGALVDAITDKRLLAASAVGCISGSALLIAIWPTFAPVIFAKLLHATASCLLGPAMAAISLGLVGYGHLSARLGRNARYLSLGNAIAAGMMGVLGYYFSDRAIFFFTAALALPALVALAQIRSGEIDPELSRGGFDARGPRASWDAFVSLIGNRPLVIFAGAVLLFQFANAAVLPMMAGLLAKRIPETATLVLSVCIFGPQFVVVAIAPWVARKTESWGRRPLLSLCFVALAVRCAVFATTAEPFLVMPIQLLDGISAATLGVLVPLILADVMRGSGHFNLAQGAVGAAIGVGASLSTTVGGYVFDRFGSATAFLSLAIVAASGLAIVLAYMPETRDGAVGPCSASP